MSAPSTLNQALHDGWSENDLYLCVDCGGYYDAQKVPLARTERGPICAHCAALSEATPQHEQASQAWPSMMRVRKGAAKKRSGAAALAVSGDGWGPAEQVFVGPPSGVQKKECQAQGHLYAKGFSTCARCGEQVAVGNGGTSSEATAEQVAATNGRPLTSAVVEISRAGAAEAARPVTRKVVPDGVEP